MPGNATNWTQSRLARNWESLKKSLINEIYLLKYEKGFQKASNSQKISQKIRVFSGQTQNQE